MATAFGPQATNASLTLPTANKNRYGGADTWFQDETVPGRNDATVLDAQFLNSFSATFAPSSSRLASR